MAAMSTVNEDNSEPKITKPGVGDVAHIHSLIKCFADSGDVLPRSMSELYERLRECFIASQDDEVIGCVMLHVFWADLAEIRSLAVCEKRQKHGLGTRLVETCLDEAAQLGIDKVFCLTNKPTFFEKLNFLPIDKMELPRKIWSDCFRCPRFPNCDELAYIYKFR